VGSDAGRRPTKRLAVAAAGLALTLALVVASCAAAASLYPPGGFRLSASNGYSLHAIAVDGDPHERPDALLLFVERKHADATYVVLRKVTVTETEIAADLGGLGSIDLHFVPSGQARVEKSACDPGPIEIDSGFYEGQVAFEGEEGFATVDAVRASGEIGVAASLICSSSGVEGFGGHAPGALLSLRRRGSEGHLEFQVKKNSPTRPTRLSASIVEQRDGLGIFRSVSSLGGPGAFRFDIPNQTALLNPPSPFQGTATFRRHSRRTPGRLRGSLSVDFPGHSNVSLAGSRGSLVRYVDHPSHPFRPSSLG
jgi:hypothetical protein